MRRLKSIDFFFFNDTATTEIYTLSLHDALPISDRGHRRVGLGEVDAGARHLVPPARGRSEEHTSELQSRLHLVCRLLLEKKKVPDKSTKIDLYVVSINGGDSKTIQSQPRAAAEY